MFVDKCSTNDAMIRMLLNNNKIPSNSLILGRSLFHMHCCAHDLNLIVKNMLEVMGDGIEKVKDSVRYWTTTPKRLEKFEETTQQVNVKYTKKLVLDCRTRWNSTYLMLTTALIYKEVFIRLKKCES